MKKWFDEDSVSPFVCIYELFLTLSFMQLFEHYFAIKEKEKKFIFLYIKSWALFIPGMQHLHKKLAIVVNYNLLLIHN